MSEIHTFDEYVDLQAEPQAVLLRELRRIILEAVPEAEEKINYGIPAYALVKDGKRDQQIMIAGYKNYVGIYPHPSTIEKFEMELAPYKTGKGSVQFPLDEPLPKTLVMKMVRYRKSMVTCG